MKNWSKDKINERFFQMLAKEMKNGESEASFAKRWGISGMSITHYKQGRIPETSSLIKLQENLHISPDWLIFGIEPYRRYLKDDPQE